MSTIVPTWLWVVFVGIVVVSLILSSCSLPRRGTCSLPAALHAK